MGFFGDIVGDITGDHDRQIFQRGVEHAKEKYDEFLHEVLHHLDNDEVQVVREKIHEVLHEDVNFGPPHPEGF